MAIPHDTPGIASYERVIKSYRTIISEGEQLLVETDISPEDRADIEKLVVRVRRVLSHAESVVAAMKDAA